MPELSTVYDKFKKEDTTHTIEEKQEEEVPSPRDAEHLTTSHTLRCENCLKNFKNKYLLKKHRLVHERENCKYKFRFIMENSNALPKNQEALSCVICAFRCNKRSMMIAHLSRKHEGTEYGSPNDSDNPKKVKRQKKITTTKTTTITTKNSDNNYTDKREFVCIVCGLICSRKETLKSHFVRKHTQHYSYSCDHCGKEFKIKGDLTTHTRLNHRESPVICDVCGKTCRNSHSLYTHQKHAHYKAKYECPVCHRRLVTKENLDQHVLTQHERKEKSVCEECGKTFYENYDLRKHMRIHTGDKPYVCKICGRAFARHSSLSQHLLLHTGERIYACDVCGKSFAQKAGLICHRKIHSGSLPPLPVIHIDHILKEFMKE